MDGKKNLHELTIEDLLGAFVEIFDLNQTQLTRELNKAFLRYHENLDSDSFAKSVEDIYFKKRESCIKNIRKTEKEFRKAHKEGNDEKIANAQKSLLLLKKELARLQNIPRTYEDVPLEDWPEASVSTIWRHVPEKDKSGKKLNKGAKCHVFSLDIFRELWDSLADKESDKDGDKSSTSLLAHLADNGFDVSDFLRDSSEDPERFKFKTKTDAFPFLEFVMKCAFESKKSAPKGPTGSSEKSNATDTSVARPASNDVIPATYRDLLQHGWTKESIADALVAGDYETYDIDAENEGSPSQWQEFLSGYPETFQYLVTEDFKEIAGNFSFVSLTKVQAKLALKGKLYEADLSPDLTRDLFSPAADHILFLLNLSLREPFGETKNHILLRKLFLSQILHYAEHGIFFRSMIMSAHRKTEEAFLRFWGFRYVTDHEKTGRIYALDMIPFPLQLDQALKMYSDFGSIRENLKRLYDSVPAVVFDEESEDASTPFALLAREVEEYYATHTYVKPTITPTSSLSETIDSLPTIRWVAVHLLEMAEIGVDLFELYDPLFKRYKPLLTEEELYALTQRAKTIWDSSILEAWGIQSEKAFPEISHPA